MTPTTALPARGRPAAEILAQLKHIAAGDPDYNRGRLWSLVYYLDDEYADFLGQAYQQFAAANGLNPTAFKSLKRFEDEIVAAVAGLQHAPAGAAGVLTSGGTESCLLAVKTYRDLARAERKVRAPEMVLPVTAHVAWFKASEYFDVKVRLLPLDRNLRADASRLEGLLNRNTVMILGSAPEYPHGTVDPIEAFAEAARPRGIPLHVDACVGGFVLPFIEMNGRAVPRWDYRVDGVTSISADVHKYGFGSKGASTITYRDLATMKHQMFVCQDWPGGIFASPALLGTRPGGAYAAAWAAMRRLGVSGYRDLARRTCQAVDALREGIAKMPELYLMGDAHSVVGPLLAYGSRDPEVDIFAVGDQMDARGWKINRLQRPDGLHAMVTAQHAKVTAEYLRDLRAAVAAVKADPGLARSGSAATYGLMSHLPLRGLVRNQVLDRFASMYRIGGAELDLEAAPAGPQGGVGGLVARLAQWVADAAARRERAR